MENDRVDKAYYEFLRKMNFPGTPIFAMVAGSYCYGTNGPTSDVDFKAVYVVPVSELVGLHTPADAVTGKDPDCEAHEVGKFCRLLLKGNPGMIEMVFNKRFAYVTEAWQELRENAVKFLSKRTVQQYLGYCGGQLHRLKAHQSVHTAGGEANGKWAYHIVRLVWEAELIAFGSQPKVYWGDENKLLMDIRAGWVCIDIVVNEVREKMDKVEGHLTDGCKLPDEGDAEWLNKWLLRVRGVQ
jgi:hypothetical protein